MAEIELSAAVADPFVHLDWRDQDRDPVGFRSEIIRQYERGSIIILGHSPFSIDLDVLNRVSLPSGRRFQKLTDRFFTYPKLQRPEVRRVFRDAFGTDLALYLAFRREVKRLSRALREFARSVFQPYRFLKLDVSWRFTETGPEGLHVDYFRREEDLHYLRMFVNVDRKPRVWTVGHRLEELVRRNGDKAWLLELTGSPSNEVCRRINQFVFDPINALPHEATERHFVHFTPGDVWICETRLNSHEIYSGHRVVATDFYVDPSSMLDPSQRVEARVQQSLKSCAAAHAHH